MPHDRITVTGRNGEKWNADSVRVSATVYTPDALTLRLDDASNDACWMVIDIPAAVLRAKLEELEREPAIPF